METTIKYYCCYCNCKVVTEQRPAAVKLKMCNSCEKEFHS